jgi:phosphoesterase RecJ-like protein
MKKITLAESAEIYAEITKASSILMHCHPNSDGDSLGSTLALAHTLTALGKKVTVIEGDTPLPKYLSFLPGYETIVRKNYFDLTLSDYDLFLILDAASLLQISRIQPIVFPEHLRTVVIDHHQTNPAFAELNFIDSSYPATAQMVYDLIKAWNLPLTHDSALCLFIGIYTDTGGFQYSATTDKTFNAAAELVHYASDFTKSLFELNNSSTEGRLKFEAQMLASIEHWFNNKVAVAGISYETIQKEGIKTEDAEAGTFANKVKSVPGWDLGITLVEYAPNEIKLSFRTRDQATYDVSKIASSLGGGGHKGAAGAYLKLSLLEAHQKLKETLPEVYPNLKS